MELRLISWEEWDAWIEADPGAMLFHTSSWLRLLEDVYALQAQPLGAWQGDELLGLFPLQRRRLGPFRLAGSPLMQVIASTSYLGPLVPPRQLAATLLALEDALHSSRTDHIELAFPARLPPDALAQGQRLGYTSETCQAVIVSLAGCSREQLWRGLSPACRRAVRKAQSAGIEVVAVEDGSFIPEYYRMCLEVYRPTGRLPHLSQDFYTRLWQRLAPLGQARALLAYRDGKLLAGAIFLHYRQQTYYLSGASYDHAQALRPNNLIQWHFMQWAAGQGCTRYDLGGAVIPGITRFKLSLGGVLHPYTRLHRARTPLARLGRAAYKRLIPIWRRVKARAGAEGEGQA